MSYDNNIVYPFDELLFNFYNIPSTLFATLTCNSATIHNIMFYDALIMELCIWYRRNVGPIDVYIYYILSETANSHICVTIQFRTMI